MIIRNAKLEDLEEIAIIEKEVMTMAWSYDSFLEAFNQAYTLFKVAEIEGKIAGYIIFYLTSVEAELPDVVVSNDFRRRGVGKALLDASFVELKDKGIEDIFLEVREGNVAALSLYKQYGFEEIGVRKNFYRDPVEHAICMKLTLE